MGRTVHWALVSSSAVYLAAGVPAAAQARPFDIPAQTVRSAIGVLGHQGNVQIVAARRVVKAKQGNAVRGSMTAEQALDALLRGTGLTYQRVGAQTFTVVEQKSAAMLLPAIRTVALAGQQIVPSSTPATAGDARPSAPQEDPSVDAGEEVVVVGIRESLERAAEIKRDAPQIVDSIVSEDIGKFPDPTTAAALQRVPGVQVAVTQTNEIGAVRVRGLPDILSTLDGREVFSTTGRSFSLADIPAPALARVDVVKSQTAELIEGGIAGIVDLQLNKPFNFKRPTMVITGRGTYSVRANKLDPQITALVTDTWDTGIGEIGALLNVSYASVRFNHPRTREGVRRSLAATPFNLPGIVMPNVSANNGEFGRYQRPEANASIQWRASDSLQIYADGLYTGYRERSGSSLYTANFFNPGTTISNVVVNPDQCFDARVTASGQAALPVVNTRGTPDTSDDVLTLPAFTLQRLCNLKSATFNNVVVQQGDIGAIVKNNSYLGALGFKLEQDNHVLKGDFSYQRSTSDNELTGATVGRRATSWQYSTNPGEGSLNIVTPDVGSTTGLVLQGGFTQNYSLSVGELYAGRLDGELEFDSPIKKVQYGVRYADRSATFTGVNLQTPAPGGVLGTATEASARLVSSTTLPPEFLGLMPSVPRLNNGQRAAVASADFLNSESGRQALRSVFGLASGTPADDPSRQFDSAEKTLASYFQSQYEIPLGGLTLDGVVGVRATRTRRNIAGFSKVTIPASGGNPARTENRPVASQTTDVDVLPNASARLRLGNGLQFRGSFSKTIRRPEFNDLNPGVTYTITTNPNLLNSGSAGNPNLRPQKSDAYDVSAEYYFGKGFVAVALYKRDITDRVVSSANVEPIDGIIYSINRPRNVGAATLKGVEVSGQTFFDFLPGPLSGFGVFGNFTLADTVVKGTDILAGRPLQGVSKYNYNVGLLYEKYGLSARAVYTYRSKYYDGDETGTLGVRATDPARASDPTYQPTLLNFVAPSGRLDASLSYDVNDDIRLDFGATNILRAKYEGFYELRYLSQQYRFDETSYSLGIRVRL